jgi:hypothetical protein
MDNYDNRIYPDPEHEKIKTKSFFRRNQWTFIFAGTSVVAIAALILVLIGRSAASTNPATSSSPQSSSVSSTAPGGASTAVTPTPSPVTAGTVLCQYDATHSFTSWNNSPEWKQLSDGTLGSDGTDTGEGSGNFMAWSGCQTLSTPNYAVEAQIQYVRSANPDNNNNNGMFEFGIMLRGDGGTAGYEVGVGLSTCSNATSIAMISLIQQARIGQSSQCDSNGPDPLSGSGSSQNYNVDTNFHTYRAAVTNNTITLSIDGNQLLQTSDNTFTNAGQVGLRDIFGDINVKSFTVTAL